MNSCRFELLHPKSLINESIKSKTEEYLNFSMTPTESKIPIYIPFRIIFESALPPDKLKYKSITGSLNFDINKHVFYFYNVSDNKIYIQVRVNEMETDLTNWVQTSITQSLGISEIEIKGHELGFSIVNVYDKKGQDAQQPAG